MCDTHGKHHIAWTGVIDVGTRGKRRRKSIGYHSTKADAVAAEQELIRQWGNGLAIDDHDLTVGDWLDRWWEGPARLKVRPTTHRSYRFQVDAISAHLGDVKLQDLSLARWQAFLAHLVDEKGHHSLAPRTARSYHAVMRRALQVALSQGLIVRNVLAVEEAFTLRIPPTELSVWSIDELVEYLEEASQHRLGLALHVLTFTGARRGEVVGMQWRDVDLEAGTWKVSRAQLITGPGERKSKAGYRIVGLDEGTIEALKKWRSEQREELLAAGVNAREVGDLAVFNRPLETVCVHPDTVSKLHYKVTKQAGLPPMKMHGLRHAHATYLIASG
ncbi:MAG: site-specific integrase, partial [Actinomycetia bacterium]|nr:site-specific integrase [Actinomycetes bacterium]